MLPSLIIGIESNKNEPINPMCQDRKADSREWYACLNKKFVSFWVNISFPLTPIFFLESATAENSTGRVREGAGPVAYHRHGTAEDEIL